MAGKPKSMSQIKQLILLRQQGRGAKHIAKVLGMSKNTVKSYLKKLTDLTCGQLTTSDLLKLELPELEAKFHPGNPAYKDLRFDTLKDNLEAYVEELKRTGVNKKLLWEEYRLAQHNGYSYSQFCFHIQQHLKASKPSMVLTHHPAEKLFIDFAGKKLSYYDKATGEQVECHVFCASLPYSDYHFVMAVRSQTTEDFLYALGCCLEHLGGVPQVLVPDNLKSAVTKASKYEPTINRSLEDFANHYGFTILPARVRKPKDKALVENQVQLIYNRVYAKLRNMIFHDLESLNAAISEKVKDHNQTRMQQKPWSREEKFLADEKPLLGNLPVDVYQIKYYKQLTVAKNNHIYLSDERHYYSVPYTLIGKKVKVCYTRTMVYIFYKGQQVAVHTRGKENANKSYSSQRNHLCSHHQKYLDRSPEYYLGMAAKKSLTLYQLIEHIFKQNRYPEHLYRTCDGLFRLHKANQPDTFEKACQLALDYKNYSYGFVKNVLDNKMAEHQDPIVEKPLPNHGNLRGKYHYQQLEIKFNTDESD
jgi:transposase